MLGFCYSSINYETLVQPYRVISFDIFDTLLYRIVSKPTDVFYLMEHRILEEFGITHFHDKRILAEKRARDRSEDEDITLKEIYTSMQLDTQVMDLIMEYEKEAELSVLRPDPIMVNLLKYCNMQGKLIIIISDMYHEKTFLKRALQCSGIDGYSELYVSSDRRVTKASGSLYLYVAENENIYDRSVWLHIGDNRYSDFFMPKMLGIHAYQYDNKRNCSEKRIGGLQRLTLSSKLWIQSICGLGRSKL